MKRNSKRDTKVNTADTHITDSFLLEDLEILKKTELWSQDAGDTQALLEPLHPSSETLRAPDGSSDNSDTLSGNPTRIVDKNAASKQKWQVCLAKLPSRYEVHEMIGRGGNGVVYLGEDKKENRLVAIKFLLSGEEPCEKDRQRFYREGKVLMDLSHPRIIQVYDVGTCGEVDYLVMEYFPSKSLSQILREEKQTCSFEKYDFTNNWELCCEIVEKILEALEYAHDHQIVHRDIKPDNVLFQGQEVKIIDFGLAREINPEHTVTTKPMFLGTPVYSSPEQALPSYKQVDQQSDLFSVGIILYELLTGRLPFFSLAFVDLLFQISHEDPIAPRSLNSNIPKELEGIVCKALEKNKNMRYKTAREFAVDLQNVRKGEKVKAPPLSFSRKVKKRVRKHYIAFIILGGSLLLVLATIFASHKRVQDRISVSQREAKVSKFFEVEKLIDEGNFLLARSLLEEVLHENPKEKKVYSLMAKLKKYQNQQLGSYLEEAKYLLNQGSNHPALELLIKAEALAPESFEVKELLSLARIENLTLDFEVTPFEASFQLFDINPKTLAISARSTLIGKASSPKEIPWKSSFLIEFTHTGYIPVRTILSISKGEKYVKIASNLIVKTKELEGMVYVPACETVLGSNIRVKGVESLPRKAYYLEAFLIDRNEVTHVQYLRYLEETKRNTSENWPSSWVDGKIPSGKEDHPVSYISWKQADEYAKYYGKILPTSEQWELAAVATDGRPYPWGTQQPSANAVKRSLSCLFQKETVSVGSMQGDICPYGARDLGGNLMEWTRTPVKVRAENFYIIRGGSVEASWLSRYPNIRMWGLKLLGKNRYKNVGFRCVKEIR